MKSGSHNREPQEETIKFLNQMTLPTESVKTTLHFER